MLASDAVSYPIAMYDDLYNRARSSGLTPKRWRISESLLESHPRLLEVMDLPVYYAHDTDIRVVILETDQGDVTSRAEVLGG